MLRCLVRSIIRPARWAALSLCVFFLPPSPQIAARSSCRWWRSSWSSTWRSGRSRRPAASSSATSWRCSTGRMWWGTRLSSFMCFYFPLWGKWQHNKGIQESPCCKEEAHLFYSIATNLCAVLNLFYCAACPERSTFYSTVNLLTRRAGCAH